MRDAERAAKLPNVFRHNHNILPSDVLPMAA
jgi:hypothetical protein